MNEPILPPTAVDEAVVYRREIKSFVRREGRLTTSQADALERLWPRYGIDAPTAGTTLDLPALFGRTAAVVFEIGFGAGEALLHRAAANPERDFIGVEVHRPGVGQVLHRAEKLGLSNLRVICHDAVEVLRDWLPAMCLRELILEFPDPWHKKRHHKRRIVQQSFLDLVHSRLQRSGLLRMATDWEDYARHMAEALAADARFVGGEVPRPDSRPVTRFEARGQRLGHGGWDFCVEKR